MFTWLYWSTLALDLILAGMILEPVTSKRARRRAVVGAQEEHPLRFRPAYTVGCIFMEVANLADLSVADRGLARHLVREHPTWWGLRSGGARTRSGTSIGGVRRGHRAESTKRTHGPCSVGKSRRHVHP
jgi:hypothetical protein